MGREVRRVPLDWEHPHEWRDAWDRHTGKSRFKPLFGDFAGALADFRNPDHWSTEEPDPIDYMPDFSDVPEDRMGIAMYETTSEGTPISPVFRTAEELAHWLADHKASAFGAMTATYEQWIAMIDKGWAPSAVADGSGLRSGVAAMGDKDLGEPGDAEGY